MKNLWGLGLSLAATTQRLSTASQGSSASGFEHPSSGLKTKGWPNYLGLILTAFLAALYPFAAGQHHNLFAVSVFAAIGFSSYTVLYRATRDLARMRIGVAFCMSLALAAALILNEYSVALNLTVFSLLIQTIEDWLIGGGVDLPSTLRLHCTAYGTNSDAQPSLPLFEKSSTNWLQGFLIYLSLAAAAFTIFLTGEVRTALAVLIVGSVSALSSSMLLLASGCARHCLRHGLIIKKDGFMERIATVNVAVLDEVETFEDTGHPARQAVQSLHAMKIETVLFTAAPEPVGKALSQRLGVSIVEAELFAEDKPFKIAGLQRRHSKVVFVGDETSCGSSAGVADVRITIGSECLATTTSEADAILLNDDLNELVEVIRVARRANRIADINAFVAVLVVSVGIGLAMQGKVSPQLAIAVRFTLQLALILGAFQFLRVRS